jgi:hypothetical protein
MNMLRPDEATIWLEKTVIGFSLLSGTEREAIKDFALLWTVYEGMVLDASGSAAAIKRAVGLLKSEGRLSLDRVLPMIRYFRDRYFDGIDLTDEFYSLHMRRNDDSNLVERVLRGKSNDDPEMLSAVLIIIYRLRNNLFHGVKWSYGIRGQLGNFQNANAVLMAAIEMHLSMSI